MSSPHTPYLLALIRTAQHQLGYMRANRRQLTAPDRWIRQRQEESRLELRQHKRFSGDEVALARLASRWAVADARRNDNPRLAERLDRQVEATGVSRRELEAERNAAYERGRDDSRNRMEDRNAQPEANVAMFAAPIGAALIVTAALYDNAANWEDVSADQLEVQDQMWTDPVSPTENVTVEAVSESPMDYSADVIPYSIEEQLSFVATNGGYSASTTPAAMDTSPEVSLETDLGAGVGF